MVRTPETERIICSIRYTMYVQAFARTRFAAIARRSRGGCSEWPCFFAQTWGGICGRVLSCSSLLGRRCEEILELSLLTHGTLRAESNPLRNVSIVQLILPLYVLLPFCLFLCGRQAPVLNHYVVCILQRQGIALACFSPGFTSCMCKVGGDIL